MRMRTVPAALFLLAILIAASGCAAPSGVGACPDLPGYGTISAVSGSDATVVLDTDERAVLHLAETELLKRDGGSCAPATLSDLRVGATLRFRVDAWAESYPIQGWPEQALLD